MRKTFEPKTVRLKDEPVGVHLTEQVVERNTSLGRRKVKTLVKFPVFRGMDNRTFKQLQQNRKYQLKLAMWRRREEMLAEEAAKNEHAD